MTDNHDDIHLMLGKLCSHVESLRLDNRQAKKSRKESWQKLEAISKQIMNTELRIKTLEERLAFVEKPILQMQKWQERGIGALILIGLCCTIVGGTLAAFWHKLVALGRMFF